MDTPTLIKHSLQQAFQSLQSSHDRLSPFSYVIRDGVANVLTKNDLDAEAAAKHMKEITRPMPGLSHYTIVWEEPFRDHPRAIYVEGGSADLEPSLVLVQPFIFREKGLFSKRKELISAAESVLLEGPPSRIYGQVSAA